MKILKIVLATLILSLVISIPVYAEETIKSGRFKGASNHVTKGSVNLVKTADGHAVVLAPNFSFDGAPDPKVGFGKDGKYDISTQIDKLRKNSGQQRYTVKADTDLSQYNEVYIWCEAYSVPLGIAKIK